MESPSLSDSGNWEAGTWFARKLAKRRRCGNFRLGPNAIQRADSEAETLADEILPVEPVCGFHGPSNGRPIHKSPEWQVKDGEGIISSKNEAVENFRMVPKLQQRFESIGEGQR